MPTTPRIRIIVIEENLIGTGQSHFQIPGSLFLKNGSSSVPSSTQTGLFAQSNGTLAIMDSSSNVHQLARTSDLITISGVVVSGGTYVNVGSVQDGGIVKRVGNNLVTVSGYTGSYVNAQDGLTYMYQSGILMSRA